MDSRRNRATLDPHHREIAQPHTYAWSTVLHIPTDQGTLFFKATAHETIYEAALTQALAHWFPDCMPEFVAVDMARGWMLMRDGGEQLRASIRPTQDITPWKPVIARYAEVQVGLVQHVTEMLSLRVPDQRLKVLPALFAELLADEASLMIDQEKGLTSTEFQQLKEGCAPNKSAGTWLPLASPSRSTMEISTMEMS
jgi:hypothetical protein